MTAMTVMGGKDARGTFQQGCDRAEPFVSLFLLPVVWNGYAYVRVYGGRSTSSKTLNRDPLQSNPIRRAAKCKIAPDGIQPEDPPYQAPCTPNPHPPLPFSSPPFSTILSHFVSSSSNPQQRRIRINVCVYQNTKVGPLGPSP
jgi:hypothetical protein